MCVWLATAAGGAALLPLQVLNGSLWVHHITERLEGGWYPAPIGPGNAAAKGRVPYAVLALMETLRMFPGQVRAAAAEGRRGLPWWEARLWQGSGSVLQAQSCPPPAAAGAARAATSFAAAACLPPLQIPDVDAILHFADFPCIPRPRAGAPPAPILGLQGSAHHSDIPFSDYTYWGHEHQYLQVSCLFGVFMRGSQLSSHKKEAPARSPASSRRPCLPGAHAAQPARPPSKACQQSSGGAGLERCACCAAVTCRRACHPALAAQDPWGKPAHGWGNQAEVLARKYENVSWRYCH